MGKLWMGLNDLAMDLLYVSVAVIGFAAAFALLWLVFQSVFAKKGKAEKEAPIIIKDAIIQSATTVNQKKETNFFTLSRTDVFDHAEKMNSDKERFPVKVGIKQKKSDDTRPDFLLCGGRAFAQMYGKTGLVFSMILRLDKEFVKAWQKSHLVELVSTPLSADLYHLVIDNSYKNKNDVYFLIDTSYDYVMKKLFSSGSDNAEAAKAELSSFEKESAGYISMVEKGVADSEKNYLMSLEKFRMENAADFIINRKEIANETRNLNNPDITIVEPASPQFPMNLKWKGKTYAMLYASEMSVLMIVRIPDEYAGELSVNHPEVYRAIFPKGRNWYAVQVDGSFTNKESVYEVLTAARVFVGTSAKKKASSSKKPATPKKPLSEKSMLPERPAPPKKS